MVKIPNLNEENANDMSYQFGNTRVSPYFHHTALKGYQVKPNAPPRPNKNLFKVKKHMKNTKLSRGHTHMGFFSTLNTKTEESMTKEEQVAMNRRKQFLLMKFNSSFAFSFNQFQ